MTGRRHLTPLAGRDSSPAVSLAWAAANLLGGSLLLRGTTSPRQPARWDDRRGARLAGFEGSVYVERERPVVEGLRHRLVELVE